MKAIQAEYNEASKAISIKKDAEIEDWFSVCRRFNDDVSRICDVTDIEEYTGLFECFDDENNKYHYLVREDKALYRMKRRHFYDNLGLE
ncbi:hypothetical protein DO021_20310 [Desulfobacter hydrogenophilus]|uniref:Uncharacterized protein n=1 Tax=Desulfobacter hydrogenophilus TaxID=2291 RepID=A0A328FAT4_9BACT|nr:hypothetical protein [Desulfobacter hydrogenophilus]NDY74223.1 hypothetical protein [Desulfobacter hydrogenophilus]QBH14447.1 hypothetical protein EYB58_16860 [Desulfobacter hydrogenophilus]RAM00193.1 hypothetical protein DO021_20310 [Desulfobacter hydrogenophilus]